MKLSLHMLILLVVFILANVQEYLCQSHYQNQDYCRVQCDTGGPHTMCLYQAGGSCQGPSNGLSEEEKKVILDVHNELRSKVASGGIPTQPSASDMNELLWDQEIADIAQRWIEQCRDRLEHDTCRNTKDGTYVGQNLAAMMNPRLADVQDRTDVLKQLVWMWFDEVNVFDRGVDNWWTAEFKKIGHYTQLVWGSTTHVGCGLRTKGMEMKLACNYKPGGNYKGQPVYTTGEPASKCEAESEKYPGLCGPKRQMN